MENKRREFKEKKEKLIKDLDEERRRVIEEQNRKIFHSPTYRRVRVRRWVRNFGS